METDALRETLQEAGLSPYQAAAYVAVLELGTASATEVADHGDVPAPRIYDVLASLEQADYVETYEQESLHVRAHGPAEMLDDLRSRADRLQSAAEEVEDRWEQPELDDNAVSVVQQFQTILDRARLFVRNAEHRIQLSVTPEHFEALRPALVEADERGVHVRASVHTWPDEPAPDPGLVEDACREARYRTLPAPFVALVDRQKTCFTHHPDSFDRYGIVVNDRTHAYVFHWYFLTCLWEPWETMYAIEDEGLPREYIDIRYCVRDLRPLLDAGETLRAIVEGYDLETGERRDVAGRVVDAMYAPDPSENEVGAVLQLGGQVTLLLETDEGEIQVGGWGSVVEDVEATRIAVARAERGE